MRYFTTYVFLVIATFLSNAQSFPNLNASTGNWGEYPVDKDTNVYLFHGNRLVKTDKNFNAIWANTYSGLSFSNILLSKTGCLFFIAGKFIGRIEANGTLTWCKDLQSIPAAIGTFNFFYSTSNLNSLLLDHNNDLIITGNASSGTTTAFYLKTDTNGNALKLLPFANFLSDQLVIMHDSAGYYRFFGVGWIPKIGNIANEFAFTVFNDATNTFVGSNYIQAPYKKAWNCRYMRSRFNNSFYIHLSTNHNDFYYLPGLMKCEKDGSPLWRLELGYYQNNYGSGFPTTSQFPIESRSGDILLGLITNTNTNIGAFKIDSNGVTNNSGIDLLTSNATFTTYVMPFHLHPHSMQTIYGNKYYEVIDSNSYFSPLIVANFTTTVSDSCHSLATCNSTLYTSDILQPHTTPTIQSVTSYTINSYTPTVSPVSFSREFKYCTIHDTITDVGIKKNVLNKPEFKLFPSPVKTKLKIQLSDITDQIEILDLTGKVLFHFDPITEIDVSKLPPGLYFLKIRSSSSIYTSKFIKE